MKRKILSNDISELLDSIREQYEIIRKNEGKIPQIELDIILNNIRKLYENLLEVNKLNSSCKSGDTTEEIIENTEMQEDMKTLTEKGTIQETELIPPKESIENEIVLDKTENIKSGKTQQPDTKTKKHDGSGNLGDLFSENENLTVADKFKNEKKSYHDQISGDKTLADMIKTPINDLRTGVGVNDRFLFINEIFKGSMADYDAAIEEINKQKDLNAALEIWAVFKIKLNCKNQSEAVKRFEIFIHRRFI